jgi:hypothetical protein
MNKLFTERVNILLDEADEVAFRETRKQPKNNNKL